MTPSQSPIRAATAGLRSREVKSSSAGAGGRRDAARRTGSRIVIGPSVVASVGRASEPWPSAHAGSGGRGSRCAASAIASRHRPGEAGRGGVGGDGGRLDHGVHVAQHRRRGRPAAPRPPAHARSPGRSCRSTSGRRPAPRRGRRRPAPAPTSRRPRPAPGRRAGGRRRRHDVLEQGRGDLGRVHPDLHDGSGAGRRHVGVRVRRAAPRGPRRAARAPPRRRAGRGSPSPCSAASRSPVIATCRCPGPKATSKASRVSRSAAAASRAATSSPTSAPSRVLTCPPTGALATTSPRAGAPSGPNSASAVVTGSPARSHGPRASSP